MSGSAEVRDDEGQRMSESGRVESAGADAGVEHPSILAAVLQHDVEVPRIGPASQDDPHPGFVLGDAVLVPATAEEDGVLVPDLAGDLGKSGFDVAHAQHSIGANASLTVHAACGKSWKQRGNRTGHCSGCHQTFEGTTLFDLHRRGGGCADLKEMTVAGKPLRFDDTHGDGSWWSDTSHLKAAYGRTESAEGTPGAGDASEAVDRRAWKLAEVVGDHDAVVMQGMGGVWVECECSWISLSFYTEDSALKAHAKHIERVTA